ncbi:HTH-type transcriptional regulator GltC [Labrenzia sp. THAF82]|uniref:LysR substrate-binding domain-containing protein n=1 Tax=Labrenzia sp. THAF82 TaxID=2587861 RepID=UPI00126824BE|nr:LysR family transcriptional regulator [Labrenzia sp. THAF82]QFT34082.1 HTH-type transcriptional regulator GltC [Labrenzia sp. THAF82]
MPQLSELRAFKAAAEFASLRRAAKALGVGQSSISRSIKRLEDKLGVSLLERSHSGVRLTNAGKRFLLEVQPALRQLDHAKRSAGLAGRAETGFVRIGVLTSLAGGFLRKLLVAFNRNYPKTELDIRDGGREEHMTSLRSHDIDIVFAPGTCAPNNCECAELWCEHLQIAMPDDHRLSDRQTLDWSDLKEERFITSRLPPGPEFHDLIVRRLESHGVSPVIETRSVTSDTLMNLVSLGQGLTATTEAWSCVKLPNFTVRPLASEPDVLRFCAIWLAGNDNPALRCLISNAHMLAGKVRRGSSDWLAHHSSLTTGALFSGAEKPDRST